MFKTHIHKICDCLSGKFCKEIEKDMFKNVRLRLKSIGPNLTKLLWVNSEQKTKYEMRFWFENVEWCGMIARTFPESPRGSVEHTELLNYWIILHEILRHDWSTDQTEIRCKGRYSSSPDSDRQDKVKRAKQHCGESMISTTWRSPRKRGTRYSWISRVDKSNSPPYPILTFGGSRQVVLEWSS